MSKVLGIRNKQLHL